MGLPTFQGLEIAKSGMMAYNTAMQTAAHNLANVGTRRRSGRIKSLVRAWIFWELRGSEASITIRNMSR